MSRKGDLKESYDIETKNGSFYMGGKVRWSDDGETLLCPAADVINVLDVATGRVRTTLGTLGDEKSDTVLCFTANESCEQVISAHRSGLIKLWDTTNGTLVKTWRSIHRGPISELALDKRGHVLASGATDGIVRLWDIANHACTHALRGCQGVISVLEFRDERRQVFGCGDDLKIRCWDMRTGTVVHELAGHFSKVTGLAFHSAESLLISCARDKVLILWDLNTGATLKTVPVYETLEGVFILPPLVPVPGHGKTDSEGVHVAIAGDKGAVRMFDVRAGREEFVQTDSKVAATDDGSLSIVQLLVNVQTSRCAVVTADQNIILHSLDTFKCDKQLVGYADEILDVAFLGPEESHVAVATNSADIKVYNMADQGCQLLRAHSDFVLALAVTPVDPCLLLSAGKDGSVRLWVLDVALNSLRAVAAGSCHTAAVSSVCFASTSADTFLSASRDTTLKVWRREAEGTVTVVRTEVAHGKDINCVTVAPNDRLVATASQDKTIKVWSLPELSLLGILSGHRRGVWSLCFSPVDQILLSTSADCTLKLWSIADLTCLKTLEGHESSVLKAQFLSRGMQIISCSGDGLLKLWTIKSSECTATFEGHDGKVWALDVSKEEDKLVTGGSDSQLLVWRDTTEEKRVAATQAREAVIMQEQQLANLINADRLLDALALALDLDRPFKVLNIMKDLIKREQKEGLTQTLSQLTTEQKERLLKCAAAWNCNAKHCAVAQLVIYVLIEEVSTGTLPLTDLPAYIQDTLPYTERHLKRLTNTLQGLQLLQYTLQRINPALAAPSNS